MQFVAIGPSTEKAMIDANLPPCKVATKPNPEAVYEAIKCILWKSIYRKIFC